MSDNIGGIVSAEYCLVREIQYCGVLKHGILLELKSGCVWKQFPAKIGNIDIDITENLNVVRDSWTVEGKIRCPRNKYENTSEMVLFRQNKNIVIKYTTSNGDIYIAGDMHYSLQVSTKILDGTQASAYSGVEFSIKGAMYHPQLPQL